MQSLIQFSPGMKQVPRSTWWKLGAAAAAGFWIAGRVPPLAVVLVSGAVIGLLPRRSSRGGVGQTESVGIGPAPDSLWPEAPAAEPFVPHTQAWDELRQAISPVVHSPAQSQGSESAQAARSHGESLEIEGLIFEATEPFILDERPDERK